MSKRPQKLVIATITAALVAVPASANASAVFGILPQSVSHAAGGLPQRCDKPVTPAIVPERPVIRIGKADKSSALLGGRPSALEMMLWQQAGRSPVVSAEPVSIRPAAAPPARPGVALGCQEFALPDADVPVAHLNAIQDPLSSYDFLATKRLSVSRTVFDAEWNRVRHQGLPRGKINGLALAVPGPASLATLAAVNSWTNSRVKYVEDRELYGRADYWANASTTLKRRAGDCEDIAILKLQLLSALGVPQSDMYLTVARDLVRNADHAVLVVKLDGKHWLLDNSTNRVLDASRSYDYRPIMSFSQSHKWLHGYARL